MSSINPYNIGASSSNGEISGLDAIYIYVAIMFLLIGYAIYMYLKERGTCTAEVSLEFNNRTDTPLSTPITTEPIPVPSYSEIDILDVPPSYESLFPKAGPSIGSKGAGPSS
ncbi:hypothetical protein NEAUS04_2753 [Nematocida ausubeli]|uniref:Uncharacterized protein n=1 Tax=Nematocida ausubeli (strain ATCC PRA-371 / ERTm2) TaxID=1913371 RepID=A0A086J4S2_NEMA1|nr:uncharacterized protein NESG_00215 [Nematocida ausubeli]KAI5141139.1 hypothetical protein NEAUS07_2763 [Nematocida ausubeli]KAI5152478.1 hypothetical protein NEAUS05_2730 [Nematocida ausubeli]KAI5167989.1 hypothetical protein NEAUS04_2753 [Nematocida ausubeli]KFG27140.1 hypothetical protein NESG_00215 [Nematocida ausubeli]